METKVKSEAKKEVKKETKKAPLEKRTKSELLEIIKRKDNAEINYQEEIKSLKTIIEDNKKDKNAIEDYKGTIKGLRRKEAEQSKTIDALVKDNDSLNQDVENLAFKLENSIKDEIFNRNIAIGAIIFMVIFAILYWFK